MFTEKKDQMVPEVLVVFCTVNKEEIAQKIAHTLISKKVAACVNIVPNITSVYHWENQVQEEQEFLLVIKTGKARYLDLEKTLKEIHPYEVPEIIALNVVAGSAAYLDWVMNESKK